MVQKRIGYPCAKNIIKNQIIASKINKKKSRLLNMMDKLQKPFKTGSFKIANEKVRKILTLVKKFSTC
jgi:hypothetical protein